MLSGPAKGPEPKRKRLQNSCDHCKKRKMRCDSAARGGACSQCISLRIECLHTTEKKKRGPPAGRSAQLKSANIQALTASILSSVPYNIPKNETELRSILRELASYIRTLEKELAESTIVHIRERSSEPTSSTEELDETDELSEQLKQLHFTHSHNRYYGKLSYRLQFIKSAIGDNHEFDHETAQISKRPLFWDMQPWQFPSEPQLQPLIFPPHDLLQDLIDLWFEKNNPFYPLLHRGVLEKSIASGLHHLDRDFGEALLAMCAVASRHSDDPRNFMYGAQISAGFVWMRQVNPVPLSFIEAPSLSQVQKLILYVMFIQGTSMPYPGWLLTGLGIRLLQDVGAHRKKASPPTVSGELWKRAFWILTYIDLFLSINIGRPRAITSDNYDVELPVEVDDEYWQQPGELAFKQPPGKPCKLTYWIHILKLVGVLECHQRAMGFVRSLRKPDPDVLAQKQRTLIEIDQALDSWLEAIPEQLKWDPHRSDPILFHQSTSLYLTYFFLRLETHRHSISWSSSTSSSSLESCLNSAHACVHIMEAHRKRSYLSLGPQMLATISNAAIMLIINMWRSKRLHLDIDIESEMIDVVKCMEQLVRFEKKIQVAGRLWDIVRNIVSISDLTDAYNKAMEVHTNAQANSHSHPTAIDVANEDLAVSLPVGSELFASQSWTLEQYLQDYGSSLPTFPAVPPESILDSSTTSNVFSSPELQQPHSFGSSEPSINLPFFASSSEYAFMGDPLKALQTELESAQQPSEIVDAMDISEGDWEQYISSVDEILRTLQQS